MKIRAALFSKLDEPFHIETLDLDEPHAGEVLVKVEAAGVCHSDWHLVTGTTRHHKPVVPGHEGAGIVERVGEGVTRVKVGERVALNWTPNCGTCFYCLNDRPSLCETHTPHVWRGAMLDGTTRLSMDGEKVYHFSAVSCFADHAVVPQECCIPISAEVPFAIAALIGCAVTTGVGATLNTVPVKPGSSVVVYGAGGVGLNVIMGAKLAGATRIIAVDLSESKGELAKSFGATDALVAGDEVVKAVREMTNGRGADYAFEAVGITSVQEQALEAIRPGGTLVLVGLSAMGSSTNLPAAMITRTEKTVTGSYYGSSNAARDFPRYADLYLKGKLDLDRLVSKTFTLDQINEAYEELLAGETARGVILF